VAAKPDLDLVAPFDFVSTCDTSTGSSGSPTVNQKGELVGMVFDANLEALPSTYMYTDEVARAVHVSTQGIVEALRKIYKTPGAAEGVGRAAETRSNSPRSGTSARATPVSAVRQ
jgi:spore germination protein GerM